jgi:hypothetical protein
MFDIELKLNDTGGIPDYDRIAPAITGDCRIEPKS